MSEQLDFQGITVSPVEAVGSLGKALRMSPQAHSVTLRRIADMVVYEIVVP